MTPEFWIAHADSLFHQIFMLFMGGLYALAMLAGVTYQTMNIYCYFVFYPVSFALFLKSKKIYTLMAVTLLFFAIPNLNKHCGVFFNHCVDFLNYTAKICNSNYIDMSVYLCVWVPLLFYIPFIVYTYNKQQLKKNRSSSSHYSRIIYDLNLSILQTCFAIRCAKPTPMGQKLKYFFYI